MIDLVSDVLDFKVILVLVKSPFFCSLFYNFWVVLLKIASLTSPCLS